MDAKRIIPILQVQAGSCGGSTPEQAAGRLELAGADEILFQAGPEPADWVAEVAAALFIPFAVERDYRTLAELEAVLEAGADKVVLASDALGLRLLAPAVRRFGRCRLTVAVDAFLNPDGRWLATLPEAGEREALAWLMELGLLGAGEILLRAQAPAGELFMRAAQLAKPILCRCGEDLEAGGNALLHGADGLVYSGPASPAEIKAGLQGQGLALRV